MTSETTQLKVSCSCSTVKHTFHIPASSLPLPTYLCSCDTSRRISGSLLTSYVDITPNSSTSNIPQPDTSFCTPYKSSEILTRWFCSTCGTHMYLEYHSDGHFEVATGTLQGESTDELVRFAGVMWIGDTKDGGAGSFLREIDRKELSRYTQDAKNSDEPPLSWPSNPTPISPENRAEAIHAHCHCTGVQFWLTPPTSTSHFARSPFPDLMIPHHLNESANPNNEPWWLTHNKTRYLAGTCACRSCRAASGFDITFWSFIPTSNIFLDAELTTRFPVSAPSRPPTYWGSMKTYQSSPGVTRTFCGTCGANVFWHGDEKSFGRRGLVDVAVGLLDAESGARAEGVLGWWKDRVSFNEDAAHRGLIHGLEDGLKEYAARSEG